jgi:hypothetical protein
MKDVATFLAEVSESRRREQAVARAGFLAPPDLCLPRALEVALDHRWLISPVRGCSDYALHSARVGVPCRDREQVKYWFAHYPEANWMLATGEDSGVLALEVDPKLSRYALDYLAGEDRSWQRTLRFAVHGRWQVLFAHAAGLRSLVGRYPGLRLHAGDSIYLPPLCTLDGIKIDYANPHAPLLPVPDWLHQAMRWK